MLFSKLETRKWPNMGLLLEKISHYVPKTNLKVCLVDSSNDKAEKAEGIEGATVKLTLSYKR